MNSLLADNHLVHMTDEIMSGRRVVHLAACCFTTILVILLNQVSGRVGGGREGKYTGVLIKYGNPRQVASACRGCNM